MWEIAGLLFFSSEVKEKVVIGLSFFKDCMADCGVNVEGSLIFFTDKARAKWITYFNAPLQDFDYISVIEELFPNCVVFLCFIHVYRYFKDKVL